jgi:hypothetical protein
MMRQPSLIPISDVGPYRYQLEKDFTYRWRAEKKTWIITIPAGFTSDGASSPRWVWTLAGITPDGLHRAAALVHDFLYRYGGRLPFGSFNRWNEMSERWEPVAVPWTRKQVDKLFANMLAEYGVSKTRRRMMYLAVRMMGGWSWRAVPKQH